MVDFFKKLGIVLLLVFIVSCGKEQADTSKVGNNKKVVASNLPKTAFLINHSNGSFWYDIEEVNSDNNKATISVYSSTSHKLIVRAEFFIVCVFDDKKDAVFIEDLTKQIDYFDGRNIQFKNTRTYLKQIVK